MAQQQSGTNGQGAGEHDNRDIRDQREYRRDKRFNDPMRGLFWGLILIILGVLFFAVMQNWIDWDKWWQIFLIGLGVIFLIDALIRYLNSSNRYGIFGRVIAGLILITIGVAFIIHLEQWWPLILIVIGVAIISRFIIAKRS